MDSWPLRKHQYLPVVEQVVLKAVVVGILEPPRFNAVNPTENCRHGAKLVKMTLVPEMLFLT